MFCVIIGTRPIGDSITRRLDKNVSASNNLLCEVVARSGCEYCISSSFNVSNLSNTVPKELGLGLGAPNPYLIENRKFRYKRQLTRPRCHSFVNQQGARQELVIR